MNENGLTADPATWVGNNFISVKQLTPEGLQLLFSVAKEMKALVRASGGDDRLKHKVLANVFYEASTRTSCSFQAAMLRLGGSVVCVNESSSSVKKGETLGDTIRCLECYADVTVLRHPVKGSALEAVEATSKPVLSAGDGVGEHPSQALLDTFTIDDEFSDSGGMEGKTVVLLGDLKHGRTVHSLAKLLARSGVAGISLRYCSPDVLRMPDDVKEEVAKYGLPQEEFTDLRAALDGADCLYVTRVQKERFESEEAYDKVKDVYIVDNDVMKSAKDTCKILHPLPRVGEIKEEVDSDPRAAYFRQMENGMFVRMALLSLVLGKAR
mmetsp:Transcript_15184/g.30240  ORF Transcript_15184/g.30240 Transcript_15184/m.30240 type:complete len:325 (-) Transcript_15184:18-992(-)